MEVRREAATRALRLDLVPGNKHDSASFLWNWKKEMGHLTKDGFGYLFIRPTGAVADPDHTFEAAMCAHIAVYISRASFDKNITPELFTHPFQRIIAVY